MIWTKEKDELLLDLRAKGLTFIAIGKELDISKNSAIGRHRRLTIGNEYHKPRQKDYPRVAIMEICPCSTKPRNYPGFDWRLVAKALKEAEKAKKKQKPPCINVHPAFDPDAKVWFLDNPKVEAKSIKQLLEKLPKGSTVLDYREIV